MANGKEATAKKPKEEKLKKPKAEKDEGEFGAKRKYPESLKIQVLNKENPHREGSSRADAFNAMLKCKTMGDYYETDNKIKYIGQWEESGHIKVG